MASRNYPKPTPCAECGTDTIGSTVCRVCTNTIMAQCRSVGEDYVTGRISRPDYITATTGLHAKLGRCVCMACVEVRTEGTK